MFILNTYSRRLPHTMHSEIMYIQRNNNKMKIMQKCFCLNELYDKLLLCVHIYMFSLHRPIFNIFRLFEIFRLRANIKVCLLLLEYTSSQISYG